MFVGPRAGGKYLTRHQYLGEQAANVEVNSGAKGMTLEVVVASRDALSLHFAYDSVTDTV